MKERELEKKMRKISKVISGIGKNKDMEIEDCQTVCEFFGVGRGEYVWINGEQFLIDNKNIENQSICHSDPIVDSKALVGCLTGQLEWSKEPPKSKITKDEEFGNCKRCGYEYNSELISEYEIEYCPKCGQKIEEAMTAEEENSYMRLQRGTGRRGHEGD